MFKNEQRIFSGQRNQGKEYFPHILHGIGRIEKDQVKNFPFLPKLFDRCAPVAPELPGPILITQQGDIPFLRFRRVPVVVRQNCKSCSAAQRLKA